MDLLMKSCKTPTCERFSLRNSDHCLACTKAVASNVRDIADALGRINVEPCEHGVRIGGAKLQTTGVHNFLASGPPGKGADLSSGYEVGSMWIDIDVRAVWLCTRSSIGKARGNKWGAKYEKQERERTRERQEGG